MGTIIAIGEEQRKLNDMLKKDQITFATYFSNYDRWVGKIRKARRWSERVTPSRRIKSGKLRSLPLWSDKVDHYLFLNGEDAIFVARSKWRKCAIRIDADNLQRLKEDYPYRYARCVRDGVAAYCLNEEPEEYGQLFM